MTRAEFNIPTIFAAFGATGDLMRRKVVPSLFHLHNRGELPSLFRVVGFSRRPWSREEYRAYIKEVLEEHMGQATTGAAVSSFLSLFYFQEGTFDSAQSYDNLKVVFDSFDKEWGVCANKLVYLAVPPEHYELILRHLSRSNLTEPCDPGEGWTHVIVEKPFGVDLETAQQIDGLLGSLFEEDQIYRIDHYLAKEMLQNILTFRFSNNLFELAWGNELIESVSLRLLEHIGVEKRGPFYDGVGALRDVGQNHLLQMLALVAMERPKDFSASEIQKSRAAILQKLELIPHEEIHRATIRGQYEGFRRIPGVRKDSDTETYFRVRATLEHTTWKGVPFYIESGKRVGPALKEIVVTFRHPMPCLCPPEGPHHKNQVVFRMEPKEEILIEFWAKKPGLTFATEPRMFHYLLREPRAHVPYVEEYGKLLLDCVRGDQTLFISTDEIKAMWRFTDPILMSWRKGGTPLLEYKPDTRDIVDAAWRAETL